MRDVSVVLPAAGAGHRMNADCKKQYLEVNGKAILTYTIEAFLHVPDVKEIIVVHPPGEASTIQPMLPCEDKTVTVLLIEGGVRRQDSVENGLHASSPDSSIVLVHDAVRPLIDPKVVQKAIQATRTSGAVLVAVPVKDTIKRAADNRVTETVSRHDLWQAQTPQVFQRDLLIRGFKTVTEKQLDVTDDCGVVEAIGAPIQIVEGTPENIKITTPGDLVLFAALLERYFL